MRTEREMLDIIINIAKNDERIRAVYLFGSRANPDAKKDDLQDYDIAFVVTETKSFQADKNWLNAFGDISLLVEGERNASIFFGKDMSILSRRCVFNLLFSDNNCLDLVVEVKEEAMKNFAIYKPNTILVDKDNFLSEIITSTETDENYDHLKPDENVYHACCSNFWWFLLYPVKGIARDTIPFAMVSYNSFTRTLLNRMIEWHIGIQTNFSVSIKRERNYEKYLPKDLYDLYSRTYTESNYWNIIFTTCELFNKLALAVGTHFNFIYNQQEEDSMINYLQKIKNTCSN
jgi:aminoglycoside 6-adenylyltransferase